MIIKIDDLKYSIENLESVLSDIRNERSILTQQIEQNIVKVNESEKYISSITEKEDEDARIFTPRNMENRYKTQLDDSKLIIESLNSMNRDLYRRRNAMDEKIDKLNSVLKILNSILISK